MGRREKWFGAVKKVFSPESKRQKAGRSKDKWGFGKSKQPDSSPSELLDSGGAAPSQEVKLTEADREQSKEPSTVATTAAAAAAATEAVPTAAPNAAKVADLATSSKVSGRSRDEAAAIKIQTAFRGYLARRALRALRGLVRLKSLIHENSVKRQATTTLRCMQTLARVQSQICSRRIRMLEENQALQRQLLLKRERELENLRMGEDWDDSLQSKEQIEAGLLSKQEAATRRERALAYAFSHQWKNSSGSAKPLFMDPTNPHWGWSWLERWMAAKPWESKSTTDRDLNDCASVKSTTRSVGAEITNAYARRDTNSDRPSPPSQKSGRPPNRQSPSTPQSNAPSAAGRAVKSASPRSGWAPPEDDARSITSVQSERHRRHSLAGSSVRDDESLASSPAVPSYMVPTKSARAKSRFQNVSIDQTDTASDMGSVGSVKKRLSFPVGEPHGAASPAGVRRHSGPPKVSIASVKDVAVSVEL